MLTLKLVFLTDSFVPMPAKYLFRSQPSVSVSSDATGGDNHGEDDDNDSKQGDNLDSSEDFGEDCEVVNKADPETVKAEVKVRKLVIKTDGMNFVSSFKRKSLDYQESTMEICDTAEDSNEEDDEDNDDFDDASAIPDFGIKEMKTSDEQRQKIAIDDDEDTNEYSSEKFPSVDDEAERAAMTISSADESEDTQNNENFNNEDSPSVYGEISYKYANAKDTLTSRHSSFSGAGHDFISDQSPLSNVDTAEDNGENKLFGGNCLDDGNAMDKFSMYQPITEYLTDSEENSFYSAETGADNRTGSDNTLGLSSWRSRQSTSESLSTQDNDQDDVKAQMESAINSILSLSQGSSQNTAMHLFSQSNTLSQKSSQLHSLFADTSDFNTSDFKTTFSLQSGQTDSGVIPAEKKTTSVDAAEDFSTDLDAAVNSILM